MFPKLNANTILHSLVKPTHESTPSYIRKSLVRVPKVRIWLNICRTCLAHYTRAYQTYIRQQGNRKTIYGKDTGIGLQRSGCNSMNSQCDFGHNSHSLLLQFPSVKSRITIPYFHFTHLFNLDS